MDKQQFLNRINTGCREANPGDLQRYFKDYAGPFDAAVADEYVRYFTNAPQELAQNADQGRSHRDALLENGMLGVNNPLHTP